jgi:hypothetical protein
MPRYLPIYDDEEFTLLTAAIDSLRDRSDDDAANARSAVLSHRLDDTREAVVACLWTTDDVKAIIDAEAEDPDASDDPAILAQA